MRPAREPGDHFAVAVSEAFSLRKGNVAGDESGFGASVFRVYFLDQSTIVPRKGNK